MSLIDVLFSIYLIFSLFVLIFSLAFLDEDRIKYYPLKTIFVFQDKLYQHMKYDLNIFGIIILETIVTALTLGASIITSIAFAIMWMSALIWKLFCFMFRKR